LAHRLDVVTQAARAVGVLVAVFLLVRLVREPVPISERIATMVTIPSGAIETKRWGSERTPCGIFSAPVA